ncbi:phenylacetate--CoA ligase family protein [Oceanispirochaeta sp.]|jgi:phenylacetate-CoA ligase|uniref:phenylacetate--CoA ligase family protein n=1 Tax=Oceanispirochaeta sp. TaxID=2035350 RepID=UPI002629131F|nr:phenylacetate--CoA ligase [Oceanispirochaeta sp.]MDA3958880.1 phenylacetate--CoA ligase [Oceanispirochaeta sp.]
MIQNLYKDAEVERLDRDALKALQLLRLKKTVTTALVTPFYKERLKKVGIHSAEDIRTLDDIRKIPYTTKDDLREAYPYGLLAVDQDDIVRMHASSGTTGTPTVIYHTQKDLDNWTNMTVRSLKATGCHKGDVFQNMMTYGLFTGGIGLHYGAEKLGMLVIPASSGNTKRQFQLMKDFQTTTVHATPSYLLHLHSRMEELGYSLKDFNLKRALIGAEPHSEEIRKKIEELFQIDAYNSYGLSEMNGPSVAFECTEKKGMHLWEDAYLIETIDRHSLEPVEDGIEGELVLTILIRTGTPILRYRTKDLTRVIPEACPCGRTSRRITRIKGRTDDMLIINGVNVFPSQIEEVIMKMPGIGTNYLIKVSKEGTLDQLTIQTEVGAEMFTDNAQDLHNLRRRIVEDLQASITIKALVELHEPGFLPVQPGKAIRVIDDREIY